MLQAERDKGMDPAEMSKDVQPHDR